MSNAVSKPIKKLSFKALTEKAAAEIRGGAITPPLKDPSKAY